MCFIFIILNDNKLMNTKYTYTFNYIIIIIRPIQKYPNNKLLKMYIKKQCDELLFPLFDLSFCGIIIFIF